MTQLFWHLSAVVIIASAIFHIVPEVAPETHNWSAYFTTIKELRETDDSEWDDSAAPLAHLFPVESNESPMPPWYLSFPLGSRSSSGFPL